MNRENTQPLTLGKIAELVDGELRGDASVQIHAVAPVAKARPGDLTWVANPTYASQLRDCQASAAIVLPDMETEALPVVVCPRPDLAIARILKQLEPPPPHPSGVHRTALIAETAILEEGVAVGPGVVIQQHCVIGQGTVIHAGVFVGEQAHIGEGCVLWPNVVVRERSIIGSRVMIQPNATIGSDGFGFNLENGKYRRIPHIGRVVIGDDVEIGANSCIDRAKCGETVIGRGTKIDNLAQIAHNVTIGEDCCIIAHVGIAGSTVIGDHVTLAGKVGVKDNITIGNEVQAGACSCISGDVPDGTVVLGIPAVPKPIFLREHSAIRRLPESLRQLRELSKRVERLEAADDSQTR